MKMHFGLKLKHKKSEEPKAGRGTAEAEEKSGWRNGLFKLHTGEHGFTCLTWRLHKTNVS